MKSIMVFMTKYNSFKRMLITVIFLAISLVYSFFYQSTSTASTGINLLTNPGFNNPDGECYNPTTVEQIPGWTSQFFGFGEMLQGDGFPQNQPFKVCAARTKGEAYGTGDGGKIPLGETGRLSQIVAVPAYSAVVYRDARMEHESGTVVHTLSGCSDPNGIECNLMGQVTATIPQVKSKSICDFYIQTMTFSESGGVSEVTYGDPATCDLTKLPETVNFEILDFGQYPYMKVEVAITPLTSGTGQSGYKAGWWSLEVLPVTPSETATQSPEPVLSLTPEPSISPTAEPSQTVTLEPTYEPTPADNQTSTSEPSPSETPSPTPSFCTCSVNLVPVDSSIYIGEDQGYEALVSTENCNVIQVDFSTSDMSVVDVLVQTDGEAPYTTTAIGINPGVSSIIAQVMTDSQQESCSDTATLEVHPVETPTATQISSPAPSASPTINVMDLEGSWYKEKGINSWSADVIVIVEEQNDQPVENVLVSGSWNGGVSQSSTCYTNAFGKCTVTVSGLGKSNASVSYTVGSLTMENYEYRPDENHDLDGDSNGIIYTVFR